MVLADEINGVVNEWIERRGKFIIGGKKLRKSMDVSAFDPAGLNGDKMNSVINLNSISPTFNLKHITELTPETFDEVRTKVYEFVTESPQHIMSSVHKMFSIDMRKQIKSKLTLLCALVRTTKPWIADGLIITGKDEQERSLGRMHWDRYMSILNVLSFMHIDNQGMDRVLRMTFKVHWSKLSALPPGVLSIWSSYGGFNQGLQNAIMDLSQDLKMIQFLSQKAVQVNHPAKSDRLQDGIQPLLMERMILLNSGHITK